MRWAKITNKNIYFFLIKNFLLVFLFETFFVKDLMAIYATRLPCRVSLSIYN